MNHCELVLRDVSVGNGLSRGVEVARLPSDASSVNARLWREKFFFISNIWQYMAGFPVKKKQMKVLFLNYFRVLVEGMPRLLARGGPVGA